ncbi:MAG: CocE/NonD family hydrolase [Pseudomonadota bacterium]
MDSASSQAVGVEETEHLWIPMPDGTRLAARLWLPAGAPLEPVPAIFEYIPYRKGDMVRSRDERNHPRFAAAGYAALRVDMRGSGDSEGVMPDMYSPHELDDARHVIGWIAEQPWCNGRVGMMGTSWGGTASLQAAIDAPPALKAIVAVCATHDRYEDDIHHKGGLLITDSIEWGATLPAILASPPDAANLGEAWYETWHHRLERLTWPLETWVREEERSPYWQWGSVTRQAERLSCPVLAVGGWSDRYSNSVMSLVEMKEAQVWGIVGPWGHHYPDQGHPGPGMDFQGVALDWWDHWLHGPNDAPSWPRLRLWLSEFDPPAAIIDQRQGQWIALDSKASDTTRVETLYPTPKGLSDTSSQAKGEAEIPYDLRVGSAGGDSGYFGRFGGLPTDQAEDDARSLVFDGPPLTQDVSLLGAAAADLVIRSDKPLAQVALRLSEVRPDGSVARIALALRNLALEDSFEAGLPLEPGAWRAAQVRFPTKAHRFAAGNRIRLAVSASYWPLAWPAPERTQLTLSLAECRLQLPCLAAAAAPLVPAFGAPDLRPSRQQTIAQGQLRRFVETADGYRIDGWHQEPVAQFIPATATTFRYETAARHGIQKDDPTSASSSFTHSLRFERPDGAAVIESRAEITADAAQFHLSGRLTARWRGERVFEAGWSPSLRRRLS